MQTSDLGHGRGWLRADAAASLLRVDRALGHPIDINDAGRTNAEQWEMWRKYGSPRAAYPGTSTHETGIAIDTDERPIALLAEHGWYRPFDFEPWHFKYVPANDRHRNDPAPASTTREDDTMFPIIYAKASNAGTVYEIKGGRKRALTAVEWKIIKAAYAAAGEKVPYARGTVTAAEIKGLPSA